MSIFDLHRSCREIETIHREQIEDLHTERDKLHAKLEETTRVAAERQQDLMDRLLAFTNPGAYSRFASAGGGGVRGQAVQQDVAETPAKFLRPLPLINRDTGQPITQRVGVRPVLEPVPKNYRKALKKDDEKGRSPLPDPEMAPDVVASSSLR
jgi:hypothetical protein